MIRRVAEYTVRDGQLETVVRAVRRFLAAVHDHEPQTSYQAFRRGDGRSFLHLMAFPDEEAEGAHRRADYTSDFVAALYPRCVEEPSFTDLTVIEPV